MMNCVLSSARSLVLLLLCLQAANSQRIFEPWENLKFKPTQPPSASPSDVPTSSPTSAPSWAPSVWQPNCGHIPGDLPEELEVSQTTVADASTLTNKVMAGYQGWFDTPCSDYEDAKWTHWAHRGHANPNATFYQFEMWPDTSEYDEDELCLSDFEYADGTRAGLFSSYNPKTVDRHVKWASQYNIDGLFVQRFLVEAKPDNKCFRDRVLDNVRRSSERYGRVFANMYDISGADDETVFTNIKRDWMYLVDVQEITKSPSYLYHNGRPLISLWGFGTLNRPGEPEGVMELLDWFHNHPEEKYRATVKGGVPNEWQTLGKDTKNDDPAWAEAFRKFDVLSPWSVGRFNGEIEANDFNNRVTVPNAQECEDLGIDYMPVVWPGFSWAYRDLKKNEGEKKEIFNKFSRRAGEFYWHQIHRSIESFPSSANKQLYVAMFDEVDEATAIMKVAESKSQLPVGEARFITMDVDSIAGIPNDWYLRLTGEASKLLKRDSFVPEEMPKWFVAAEPGLFSSTATPVLLAILIFSMAIMTAVHCRLLRKFRRLQNQRRKESVKCQREDHSPQGSLSETWRHNSSSSISESV